MTITAKYAGRCRTCGGQIHAGEKIEWSKGGGVHHLDCPASPEKFSDEPTRHGPSRKQVNYAVQLVQRLADDDYGTLTTFGLQNMTEARIAAMSSREVSDLIGLIKNEMY